MRANSSSSGSCEVTSPKMSSSSEKAGRKASGSWAPPSFNRLRNEAPSAAGSSATTGAIGPSSTKRRSS
ncbi:hypothetical protein D3C72_2518010 [compost metagenome]